MEDVSLPGWEGSQEGMPEQRISMADMDKHGIPLQIFGAKSIEECLGAERWTTIAVLHVGG